MTDKVMEAARKLPPPERGKIVTVPLDLLPAYYEIHKIEPVTYWPDLLVVKFSEPPRAQKGEDER